MDPRIDLDLLDRYLAGDASADERALVERWLAAEPDRALTGLTRSGVHGAELGEAERMAAMAPATCGAAIEVPLKLAYVVVLLLGTIGIEDRMLEPGASRSTTGDMLEKEEMTAPSSIV